MQPPLCVLIHGATGNGFAWSGDKLTFDLNGGSIIAELVTVESPPPDSDYSMTSASPSRGSGLWAALAMVMGLGALQSRRRRPYWYALVNERPEPRCQR